MRETELKLSISVFCRVDGPGVILPLTEGGGRHVRLHWGWEPCELAVILRFIIGLSDKLRSVVVLERGAGEKFRPGSPHPIGPPAPINGAFEA